MLSTSGELYNNNINKNTKKTEIITFYNNTKSGIDTFDQFCGLYSVSRKTNRWPMHIFFGMLDHAEVNAMILYFLNFQNCKSENLVKAKDENEKTKIEKEKSLVWRKFLRQLDFSLIVLFLKEKLKDGIGMRLYVRGDPRYAVFD